MLRLLQTFAEIAVWRKGPQDLPASASLLAVTAAFYVALTFAQTRLIGYPLGSTALMVVIDVGMTCSWLLGVLALFGFKSRFTQTLTAMLGVGILLGILDISIRALAAALGTPKLIDAFALPQLVIFLLAVGRILMVALEQGLLTGMALTLAMALSTFALAGLVVPPLVSTQ